MKKFVKVLSLMAVALCVSFALVACGDAVEGTYESTMSMGDISVTTTLELKDGKFTMGMKGSDEKSEGTYTVDGDKITLTADGESIEGTVKDGKITITADGVTMTYTKQ